MNEKKKSVTVIENIFFNVCNYNMKPRVCVSLVPYAKYNIDQGFLYLMVHVQKYYMNQRFVYLIISSNSSASQPDTSPDMSYRLDIQII